MNTNINTQLNPFINSFQFESIEVRTHVDEHGIIWCCAKDICAILDIVNHRDACSRLDDDEKGVVESDTLGGKQSVLMVNESGLYSLIFTSKKTEAKVFRKLVTNEILPAIRKHGFYGKLDLKAKIAIGKEINRLGKQISTTKNLFELDLLVPLLHDYCNIAGIKMPALERIKADIEQTDLFLDGDK
jgi:prophage antirepressor-like protein